VLKDKNSLKLKENVYLHQLVVKMDITLILNLINVCVLKLNHSKMLMKNA